MPNKNVGKNRPFGLLIEMRPTYTRMLSSFALQIVTFFLYTRSVLGVWRGFEGGSDASVLLSQPITLGAYE